MKHLELNRKQGSLSEREESKQKTQKLRNIAFQSLKLNKFCLLGLGLEKQKNAQKRNV